MEHPIRRPELLVCASRGHSLAGATIETLDERHTVLGRETADGRRLVQCLRCRDWVLVDAPEAGAGVDIASPAEIDHPRRGKALRQAIVLRVIAVDKALHAFAFAAVAVAAIVLDQKIDALHSWATSVQDALNNARAGNGGASTHGLFTALLERISHLSAHSLKAIALFAAAYAAVSAVEATGLWLEKRWAEYLTVVATASFLPFEIHGLIDRVTFVRIGALVINLAIVIYLVKAKHLFGIGGPIVEEEPPPLEELPELREVAAAPE